MKNICRTLLGAAMLAGGLTAQAQGLEGIIVEDYYTISAADATYLNGLGLTYPINTGTKVYRIYVDMAPNYKLNTINGSPLGQNGQSPNPLDFTTTTTFWNNDAFGTEVPPQTSRFDDGAAFDSYITIGVTGRSGGTAGCGSSVQNQGVLKFQDTNGNLTNCTVYSGFPNAGAADGNMPTTTAIPALTYNLGGLIDFSALTADGNQLTVIGDAWATLPNGPGFDPTGTNRVLIAQLTTDGQLSFHINVQLQAPGGALETYVWNQAGAGEVVSPLLTYPNVDCLGVPGGTTVQGSACSDGNACTINDVYNALCVCTGTTPSGSYDMATAASNANTVPNTTFSSISAGNNNGSTTLITNTSVSTGYTGVTGGNNAGAAAFTGALSTATSTYFEVTATPNAGSIFTLTGLSFGTRSTSTGPQAYTVRTSADGFAADVATGTIPSTSVWVPRSNLNLSVPSLSGQPLTIRIYGHSGTGSPGAGTANWRIDDLSIFGCSTTACTAPAITSTTSNSPICSTDALTLSVVATGTETLSYSWAGTGTITNGNTANATVSGATSGTYTVTVSNACGSANGTVSVTVNTATNWYADTDGDGFGAGAPTLACTQPSGFVANNTDNCPTVFGVIGSTCDDGNANTTNDVLNASCVCAGTAITAITGCSSSQSPYMKPLGAGNTTTSLLTVGDQIGAYKMVGIPDGMGAFDNNDGTFTLLMNHELGNTAGITRAHGSAGAFVSKWVINKNTLCVQSGSDLVQSVRLWNGITFVSGTTAFNRLCSADLPAVSAFFNAGTGKGTQTRIFMNGEESGAEGRAFAHIVNGPDAGISYQLPRLGKFSWENSVACPVAQDKTIVVGTDDTTPGQVYVYIGTKQSNGSEIDKAGLNNGNLYGIAVTGLANESNASFPAVPTAFTLANLGDVSNLTGAQVQTNSVTAGITQFLRPEDAAWDPRNPNVLYFVTTNSFTSPSRLYKATFTDILQPELGGTIVAVLDGTEGQKMLDNMAVDQQGRVLLQEDPGNQAYIARMYSYDIATDVLTPIAYNDSSRFLIGGASFLTQDEENSGIIDMQDILGVGKYLFNTQAHYGIPGELVEGGQLELFTTTSTPATCQAPTIAAISGAQALCSADTLKLNVAGNGTPGLSYSWSGTGNFLFGANNPSSLVTGAASGQYIVTVSNACGSVTGTVNVTVNPTTNDTTTISACDSYTWAVNGQTYTTSGTYTNVAGCDTDVLVLTITPSSSNTTTISACDSYTWAVNGTTYTTSGTYTSVTGCATEILVLTITGTSSSNTTTISACDSYTWAVNGQTYTTSGTYTSVSGCNTEILVLTINVPGTACDDGDANTINDVLNAFCTCQGTPVGGCNANEVTLTLTTDANGGQTSYDVVLTGTNTVVCSGSGFASSSTITSACCLPNGCYDLRVFDSAGDGMAAPGGYVLRDASNKRIIDNAGNGAGFTSTSKAPLGFCVPLGGTDLTAGSCDVENATLNTTLQAVADAAVTAQLGVSNTTSGYQFWVFNPNGGYTRRIFFSHASPGTGAPVGTAAALRATYFRLSSMSSAPAIPQGVLLNVRVRSRVNNVNGEFGAACRLLIPLPVCQTTQLTTAGPVISCGATNVNRLTGQLHANAVTGANKYQFEFVNANTNVLLRRLASTTRVLNLSAWGTSVSLPLCGVPYNVRVRVSFDGGATYCPFGTACTVVFTGCSSALTPADEPMSTEAMGTARLEVWPNPTNGEAINLRIARIAEGVATVEVELYDLTGKRVVAQQLPVQDGRLMSSLPLEDKAAPGVYMVTVTAGEQVFTQRIVVQ